jgi:HemK-related putative methylase
MQTTLPTTAPTTNPFAWACPRCRGDLALGDGSAQCATCGSLFVRRDGIWRFLSEEDERRTATFVREYETVRAAEGWRATGAAYFRALPEVPRDDLNRAIWARRTLSYRRLLDNVIVPRERRSQCPLVILDLGAGNCWLAHQLARRGHTVAALDLVTNDWDGLGAQSWYHDDADPAPFTAIQASFDRLPCAGGQVDLVIFNAALHYARDYAATLTEALRVLRPGGQLVILDSPLYRDAASGARMVREREAHFSRAYGFSGDTLANEAYLTDARLADLARTLGIAWRFVGLSPAWRRTLHGWKARARGRREAATMPLIVGWHTPGIEIPAKGDSGRHETRLCGLGSPMARRKVPDASANLTDEGRFRGAAAPRGAVSTARLTPASARVSPTARAANAAIRPPHSAARIKLSRFLIRWRFRLFQRHRYDHLVLEQVHGMPILVLPDVFNPQLLRTGAFMAGVLDERLIRPGAAVLDLGTGSGVSAIFAARLAGRVVATDINPAAARCAKINAMLNRVEDRVEVREGDLFAPVAGERFGAIIFNPPYYRGTPRDALDHAWRSNDTVERFAAALRDHLTPTGHALVVLSTDGETPAFLASFAAHGFAIDIVAEQDFVNEVITVYRLSGERR